MVSPWLCPGGWDIRASCVTQWGSQHRMYTVITVSTTNAKILTTTMVSPWLCPGGWAIRASCVTQWGSQHRMYTVITVSTSFVTFLNKIKKLHKGRYRYENYETLNWVKKEP